jgi:hypothetical protein
LLFGIKLTLDKSVYLPLETIHAYRIKINDKEYINEIYFKDPILISPGEIIVKNAQVILNFYINFDGWSFGRLTEGYNGWHEYVIYDDYYKASYIISNEKDLNILFSEEKAREVLNKFKPKKFMINAKDLA